jgi:hypothetical protein
MGLLKRNSAQKTANNTAATDLTAAKHKLKSFAEGGAIYIDDTIQHEHHFYAIQAIENCEVDISGCDLLPQFTEFDADFPIPSGCIVYLSGFKVQFKTGSKAIVYKRAEQDPGPNS